jgi:hypothetical protein
MTAYSLKFTFGLYSPSHTTHYTRVPTDENLKDWGWVSLGGLQLESVYKHIMIQTFFFCFGVGNSLLKYSSGRDCTMVDNSILYAHFPAVHDWYLFLIAVNVWEIDPRYAALNDTLLRTTIGRITGYVRNYRITRPSMTEARTFATLTTINSSWTNPGLNPGLRWKKPELFLNTLLVVLTI